MEHTAGNDVCFSFYVNHTTYLSIIRTTGHNVGFAQVKHLQRLNVAEATHVITIDRTFYGEFCQPVGLFSKQCSQLSGSAHSHICFTTVDFHHCLFHNVGEVTPHRCCPISRTSTCRYIEFTSGVIDCPKVIIPYFIRFTAFTSYLRNLFTITEYGISHILQISRNGNCCQRMIIGKSFTSYALARIRQDDLLQLHTHKGTLFQFLQRRGQRYLFQCRLTNKRSTTNFYHPFRNGVALCLQLNGIQQQFFHILGVKHIVLRHKVLVGSIHRHRC